MLSREEVEKIFIDSGALLTGHFLLTSGRHSEKYLQCAKILQYPEYSEVLSKELASYFTDDKIEVVVGPAMGGILLAYEIARQLNAISMFAERDKVTDKMVLRRGFDELIKGKNVLVAEDVITTGGSVIEAINAVKECGGIIKGVAVLADRSGGNVDFGVKLAKAYMTEIVSYEKDNCPLCKEGKTDAIKPGSRSR